MADGDVWDAGAEDLSEADELLRELLPDEDPSADGPAEGSPQDRSPAMVDDDRAAATLLEAGDPAPPPTDVLGVAPGRPTERAGSSVEETSSARNQTRPARRSGLWLAGLVAFGLFGIGAFELGRSLGSGSETATGESSSAEPADGGLAGGASGDEQTAGDGVDTDTADPAGETGNSATNESTPTVSDGGSTLRLELEEYRFTIDGVVPSQELKEAIEERMSLVFAEFGTSSIVVDPSVAPPDWAEAAPSIVNAMILLHEGTIEISGQQTTVAGRGLQSDFDALPGRLSAELGFPAFSIENAEVIDKPAPWVRAVAPGDGTVTLTGELADETMRSTIVDGAHEIYDEVNVIDQTTVNSGRHDRFLIMRFPSNLAAYRVFGEFDIKGENEAFTAVLTSGLVFDTLDTELTPDSQERLRSIMFTLTRNPLPVVVVGHTDSVGSEPDNRALSEARAMSVASFLQTNGVDGNLIETEGRGELEPVADNSTEEGRALNRRVQISVGLEQ